MPPPTHDQLPGRASLIVGASGQVGAQMMQALAASRGAQSALAAGRAASAQKGWVELDLATLGSVTEAGALLDRHELDAIYCIAGMTNVDGCEAEPERAQQVNARGPGVLAGYARARGLPFVYLSTEYLFAGRAEAAGPYTEESSPEPLNVYGRSKLEGEQAVQQAHPEALVIRTTVVYGPDPQRKNFLAQMQRNLSAGKPMRVPQDQVSTPTYNRDLIRALLGLVQAGASGVFHVCGPELLDRLTFARQAARHLGLDASLLCGVATAELGQRANRPLHAGLATTKLTSTFPELRMRTLAEALEDCASELLASADAHPAAPTERPAFVQR